MAERHSYGPGENFEFLLWDDLLLKKPALVSLEEQMELIALIIRTDAWVTYDFETCMWRLIELDAWRIMLENRDH
jgi:hypothetical protein